MSGAIAVLATLLAAAAGAPQTVPLPLPGGEAGIGFDDLRFSPALRRVVVPAGRTGRLDLVDPVSRELESIDGFSHRDARSSGHGDGTTSADVGDGFLFAIDRTDRSLVVVAPRERRIVARARLGGAPDYVRWVEATHEVWVTEPERERIEMFRLERTGAAPTLVRAGTIRVAGGPEALVVDAASGRAYTNTFGSASVAIDARTHAVAARWSNGCRGARGIDLDAGRGLLFVGCAEGRVVSLDAVHGNVVGAARTGNGVDGLAYSPSLAHLYVPAGQAATLTIVAVGEHGALDVLGTVPTAPDAECAVADDRGNVWVCDPGRGRLLIVPDPFARAR